MSTAKKYFSHLWKEWRKDDVTRHAAVLSYFAIFSLPAFIIVIISLAGALIGVADARTQFFYQIKSIAGDSIASFLSASIENVQRSDASAFMNVIGILFLLFAAIGIFKELEASLNKILNTKVETKNSILSFLRSYVLSFVLLVTTATLLLASIAVGSIAIVLQSRLAQVSSMTLIQLTTINQLLSYVTLGTLFFVLYRFLPAKKFPLRAIFFGTVVSTAFFVLGTFLLTFYLAQADIGHAYGVASSVLVLLLWIFYSMNIFLLGAEIIDAYDRVLR